MRPTVFCLPLLVVMWTTSVVPARADEPTPPAADQSISKETIAALIRGLADPSTAQRDAAAKRLIEIGAPAKAQLEAASKSDRELDVIRRRAKMLLLSIVRRERADRWNAFVSGKTDDGPPGWKKFRKIVGGTPDARKLFVDMYRAEPKLLETYATDPAKAAALVEALCKARAMMSIEVRPEVTVPASVAYLLAAGDRKGSLTNQAASELLQMTGLETLYDGGADFSPLAAATKEGPYQPMLRKLVGRWIRNAKVDELTTCSILAIAAESDLKEGIPIALRILQKLDTPEDRELKTEPIEIKVAIHAIGRLGDSIHIKKLESLLTNTRVLTKAESNGKPAVVKVCDVALITLLDRTGQKTKDYNVKNLVEFEKDKVSLMRLIFAPCYFVDDEHRKQAFAKWQKWRKEHPTPELIYIASETRPSKTRS